MSQERKKGVNAKLNITTNSAKMWKVIYHIKALYSRNYQCININKKVLINVYKVKPLNRVNTVEPGN